MLFASIVGCISVYSTKMNLRQPGEQNPFMVIIYPESERNMHLVGVQAYNGEADGRCSLTHEVSSHGCSYLQSFVLVEPGSAISQCGLSASAWGGPAGKPCSAEVCASTAFGPLTLRITLGGPGWLRESERTFRELAQST